jgi:hypothetical protein
MIELLQHAFNGWQPLVLLCMGEAGIRSEPTKYGLRLGQQAHGLGTLGRGA